MIAAMLALVPAPLRNAFMAVSVALVTLLAVVLFYEGLPIPSWMRAVPVIGPLTEALVDGRVDRVARAATASLVERAELNTERILRHAAEMRAKRAKAEADELAKINADFVASLTQAYTELETAHAEIEALAETPVDPSCTVGPDLLNRLRNK